MDIHDLIRAGEFDNKLGFKNGTDVREYKREGMRLVKFFQQALAEEFEMVGHPKEPILFNKAWAYGHSAGYFEVADCYERLLDLAR